MEAASHGAYEIGGRTIGLNITLSHEQFPNPYLTECLTFEYFFAHKVSLAMAAKVFVFFRGHPWLQIVYLRFLRHSVPPLVFDLLNVTCILPSEPE